jgi:hypothetical protein
MERAVDLIVAWVRAQQVDGLHVEVVRLDGRTPVVWMELGDGDETVLLYGHSTSSRRWRGWNEGRAVDAGGA